MKKLLYFSIFIFCFSCAKSQTTFQKVMVGSDSEWANSIQQTQLFIMIGRCKTTTIALLNSKAKFQMTSKSFTNNSHKRGKSNIRSVIFNS